MRSGQVKIISCQEDCIEVVDYFGEFFFLDIMQEIINSCYVRKVLVYVFMNVFFLIFVKNVMFVNVN